MANITVSSAVDTMLQSSDAAGIRTAIGASAAISTPSVGYATTSGNDTTGDGSLAKPYKTAQKLLDAGFTVWRLGVGAFGNLTIPTVNKSLYICGEGDGKTTIGTITGSGDATLLIHDLGNHSFKTGAINHYAAAGTGLAGANITIEGAYIDGAITVVGADDTDPGQGGGAGGSVTLTGNAYVNGHIMAYGGHGAGGNESNLGGDGGAGGSITIKGTTLNGYIYNYGGSGGSDGGLGVGNAGPGGNVDIQDGGRVTGDITANAGVDGNGNPGTDGTISVVMSRVDGNISPAATVALGSLLAGTFYTI